MKKFGEAYSEKGLRILLFPTREYGGQEFKDDSEILAFAESKGFVNGEHGDLFTLGNIKGANARAVWSYLYAATNTGPPAWNFKGKYLVDRNGKARVAKNLESEIEEMLAQKPAAAAAPAPAAAAAAPEKADASL